VVGGTTKPASNQDKTSGETIVPPFDKLEAIAPWGLAEEAEEGHVLRRHYPGAEYVGWIPSLSWRAAELTLPEGPPGHSDDVRWINYYGPPNWINNRSYLSALDPALVPASVFSNKVCFVGSLPGKIPFAGATRADVWRTPFSARMPGVEIIATVYLNLVHRDFLTRLRIGPQTVIVLIAGLVFGWTLTMFRPQLAVLAGLAGVVLIALLACG